MVMTQVMVFWVATLCSDVTGYQHFGGLCCCHHLHPKDGSRTVTTWILYRFWL